MENACSRGLPDEVARDHRHEIIPILIHEFLAERHLQCSEAASASRRRIVDVLGGAAVRSESEYATESLLASRVAKGAEFAGLIEIEPEKMEIKS
jgi:hypothetical protein